MADYKALQLVSGRYQQVQDGDGLIVGNKITASGAGANNDLQIAGEGTGALALLSPVGPAGNTNITFVKEQNHDLEVVASTTAATAGGALRLYAGMGKTSGVGGTLWLAAGAADTAAAGGQVSIYGGDGGSVSGAGGAVDVYAGYAQAGGGVGGMLSLGGGGGEGAGKGGDAWFTGGSGGLTGNGGDLQISSGVGGATSGNTGSVTLSSNTTAVGNSGFLAMFTGNGVVSGPADLYTGTSSAGNTGYVTIKSGNATGGDSGALTLDVGTASGTVGEVKIGTANAAIITVGARTIPSEVRVAAMLHVTDHNYAGAWGPGAFAFEVDGTANAGNVRTMGYINAINGFGHGGSLAGTLTVGCDNKTADLSLGVGATVTAINMGTNAATTAINIGTGQSLSTDRVYIGGGGSGGSLTVIQGDLRVIGVETIVGGTTFDAGVTFNEPVTIGDAPATGTTTGYANPGGGKVRVTTGAVHGQLVGDTVFLAGTGYYNGAHVITTVSDTTHFDFTAVFKGGAVTAFADSGTSPGVKTTATAAAHGLSNGDTVTITSATGVYDGTYVISNVVAGAFDFVFVYTINDSPGTWSAQNAGTWQHGAYDPDYLQFLYSGGTAHGVLGSAANPHVYWMKELDHAFLVDASTTAATVGGALYVIAGAGATTGAGGLLVLQGGNGGSGVATGGGVQLVAGNGGGTGGNGGAVGIEGGPATAGGANGGRVRLRGGAKNGAGVDGQVVIADIQTASVEIGAAAIPTNVNGALTVLGNTQLGNAGTDTLSVYPYYENHMAYTPLVIGPFGTYSAAGVTVNDAASGGNPTAVTLLGAAGAASVVGGSTLLRGGAGGTEAGGGSMLCLGGTGGAAGAAAVGGDGGGFYTAAGPGGAASATFAAGKSGDIMFNCNTGGAASAAQAAGKGGKVEIMAGDAGSNALGGGGNDGGDALLDGGDASGAGTAGIVNLGGTKASAVAIGRTTGIVRMEGPLTNNNSFSQALSFLTGATRIIGWNATSAGPGSALSIQGNQAAAGANTGGAVTLVAGVGGNTSGTGPGGAAVVRGGADSGASTALPGLFHAAGATGGGLPVTRNGGTVVTVGAAFAGTGGQVSIIGGNAVAASGAAGGNIQISSGTGDGAGVVGTITLTTGVTGGTNRLIFTHASNTITVQAGTTLNTTSTGNIDLPNNASARFKIETVAVGATVTAPNLDTLTNGSTNVTLHTHAAASATQIVVTVTAGEVFALGQLVSMQNNGGVANGYKSNVATYTTKANVLGIAASATTVVVSGEVAIANGFWDAVPVVADVGKPVYASEITAGNLTLTAPSTSGNVVQKVGVLTVGGSGACKVVVQIGDNTTL
jgi:hypothetical protein